jgi:hypothetical protein
MVSNHHKLIAFFDICLNHVSEIAPALREDGSEFDKDLSQMITLDDINGDIHMHTTDPSCCSMPYSLTFSFRALAICLMRILCSLEPVKFIRVDVR